MATTSAAIEQAAPPDPQDSARAARLRYVNDSMPGVRRVRKGRGFSYLAPDGSTISDAAERDRFAALAIPPAWTNVWICAAPNGHLQATGRDEKGRKQYRYHERWRQVRDESKFDRMIEFGKALPRIRRVTGRHLSLDGMPREKVLAAVVRLLESTLIRVGSEEYARVNGSFGLTTLRDEQARVGSSNVTFTFVGKGGKEHRITISDPRLARVVKRSRDLPGEILFQYVDDDGERRAVQADDVNAYLKDISGSFFTAKDFRTWAATVLAACELADIGPAEDEAQARRNVNDAIAAVAERLGNTPTICRKCYVHPDVIDAYLDGTLHDITPGNGIRRSANGAPPPLVEAAVLACLESRCSLRAS